MSNLLNAVYAVQNATEQAQARLVTVARADYTAMLQRRSRPEPGDGVRMVEVLPLCFPLTATDPITELPKVPVHLRDMKRLATLRADIEFLDDFARREGICQTAEAEAKALRDQAGSAEAEALAVASATPGRMDDDAQQRRRAATGEWNAIQREGDLAGKRARRLRDELEDLRTKNRRCFHPQW